MSLDHTWFDVFVSWQWGYFFALHVSLTTWLWPFKWSYDHRVNEWIKGKKFNLTWTTTKLMNELKNFNLFSVYHDLITVFTRFLSLFLTDSHQIAKIIILMTTCVRHGSRLFGFFHLGKGFAFCPLFGRYRSLYHIPSFGCHTWGR